jgi:hypothetical protein
VSAISPREFISERSLREFLKVVPLRKVPLRKTSGDVEERLAETDGESWALAAPFIADYLPLGADRAAPTQDELLGALRARLNELAGSFLAAFEADGPDGIPLRIWNQERRRELEESPELRWRAKQTLLPVPPEDRRAKPKRKGRPKDLASRLLEGLLATWKDFFDLPLTTSVRKGEAQGKLLQFVRSFLDEVKASHKRLCNDRRLDKRVQRYLDRLTPEAIRERVRASAARELLLGKPRSKRRRKRGRSPKATERFIETS